LKTSLNQRIIKPTHHKMGCRAMELALKSVLVATAMLFTASIASAQTAKPAGIAATVQAAKPPEKLDINQIVGLKKVDATTYDITARLEDGSTVELRMNAFVAQDLSRQLGNFKR
jgi:hypothetical protein